MRRACSFFAFAALAVTLLAACGGGSEEDFQTDVVAARNRTDAALEQIVRAKSIDDLLERMRIAATEIRGTATDVRDADAPDGMADDADALEQALRALSDEIVGTVTTFEQNPEAVAMASGFDFQ